MNRIREIREKAGIRQSALYRKLSWGQSRIANYESRELTPPLSDARFPEEGLQAAGHRRPEEIPDHRQPRRRGQQLRPAR